MKPIPLSIIIALIISMAACQPKQVGVLPTVAVLPSLTPTPTITPTLTPSVTPIPSITSTPTITPTLTSTTTATPTITFTPSITPTNTLTPTSTLTFTPSNTPTSTTTATAIAPSIARLDVNPVEARPGDAVTLRWISDSNGITLEIQDVNGAIVQTTELPPRGEQVITIPANLTELAVFRLTARRGGVLASRSVAVTLTCGGDAWFFGEGRVATNLCPDGAASAATGRYQPFERGYMIWVPTNSINQVYVLFNTKDSGSYLTDSLTNATTAITDPSSGLYKPQLEFEGVWVENEAPDGDSWETEIGYATGNAEEVTVTLQDERDTTAYYVGVGNNRVFRLVPDGNADEAGTWNKVP